MKEMNLFEEALRAKLVFNTKKGVYTTEQLVNTTDKVLLAELSETLNEELTKAEKRSSLLVDVESLKLCRLKNDVVNYVISSLLETEKAAQDKSAIKKRNAEIDALIAAKREEEMKKMTIEELEALRK